jgi:hypothetical protein
VRGHEVPAASVEVVMNAVNDVPPDKPSFASDFSIERRSVIRADLEKRLRKVCANLSDEEFRALIDLMTERQLKSERGKIS